MRQRTRMIALLLWAFVLSVSAQDLTHPRGADSWQELIPPTTLKEDFASLYSGLKSAHADLFVHRSQQAYDDRFRQMMESFNQPVSRFEAQLTFQRFVAFGKVAHARIDFPDQAYEVFRDAGGRTFPIYPRIVNGAAYVGENYSGDPRIRGGDEIVAINGIAVADWLNRVAEHISADSPYIAHSLMEFTFPRDLWAVVGEVEQFLLKLRRGDQIVEITIDASSRKAQRKAAAALDKRFSLSSTDREFRMLDQNIGYLRPGPFYNSEQPDQPWNNTAFVAFVDQSFEQLIEQNAKQLIIDLRANPGGDNSFSDPMLAWIANRPFRFCSAFLIRSSDEAAASNLARLKQNPGAAESVSALFAKQYDKVPRGEVFDFEIPYSKPREGKQFTGEVFVLINRHSYSNAVNVAAIVQDYKLGLIVGEKTSDMATTYGAMEQFSLPNTGFTVGFPKAHIIRPSGEPKSDGVTPDWVIASSIVAPIRDQMLETLVAKIKANRG